jgi:predicted adenine nucleotide alpha hydrolase (AANH) superfamily ATPase
LQRLKEKEFEVSGFFYNPNIHPFSEYKTRRQAVEDFNKSASFPMIYPEYLPQEFFQSVNLMEDKLQRCPVCWYLRLKRTAKEAKEKGFAYFSTTLLVSPYQDQEALNRIGNDIAREEGISFYFEDFRSGFKEAHMQARAKGIYCQKHCGCIYSELERYTCKKSGNH